MKLPPFTLVHQPDLKVGPHKPECLRQSLLSLREVDPSLADSLKDLGDNLLGTVLCTYTPDTEARAVDDYPSKASMLALRTISAELHRQPHVVTVGLWDLGSKVGRLPDVIEAMNEVQPVFTFFEVQAAIPAGLISLPDGVAAWAKERLGRPLKKAERDDILNNVIANDFFDHGETIRKDLGIDYLVGITPSMVAFEEGERVYWNFFSTYWGRTVLVSTYDLRKYAEAADRTFEAAVLGVAIAQLLTALNPRLGYHDNRGCLFDFNEERDTITDSLRDPRIEPECLGKIQPKYRDAASTLISLLSSYRQSDGVTKSVRGIQS